MTAHGSGKRRAAWPLAALAAALAAGTGQAVNPATMPEPLGASVKRYFHAQAAAAAQDHFTFYELEWLAGTAKLGPAGSAHLERVAKVVNDTTYQVILEANPDGALNLARRRFVVGFLLANGVTDADARVVIGRPYAEGLYGEEAVPIYPLMITTRFRNIGRNGRGFGSSAMGGFGMGGFGMGGFGMGGFGMGGMGGFGGMPFGGYGFGLGGYGPTTTAPGYRGLGY